MNPTIKKVAILGSGLMGSRIACHFAGIGVQVLLLDMVSPDANPGASKAERNKLVNAALQTAIKSNPSPVYTADVPKELLPEILRMIFLPSVPAIGSLRPL